MISSPVAIFPNTVNRSHAIFETDFFAFFDGARTVGNRYFMNANAEITNFGGDFWLEAVTIFLNVDFIDNFTTENFVTSFHVGEFSFSEKIGKSG